MAGELNFNLDDTHFKKASFKADLGLPPADDGLLEDVRQAVRKEYRDSAKWKRLRCRNVMAIAESDTGTVFELQIDHAVEFKWTWEGAVAFRPLLLKEFQQNEASLFVHGSIDPELDDSIIWSGEILEVDEAAGRIFVIVPDPEHPPRRGSFYVRPFEFLGFLNSIYDEGGFSELRRQLPPRLAASQGHVHPDVTEPANVGNPDLTSWWQKSWSVLWGPPGTGKTYTIGQQIAKVLTDDPTERVLVVSTTNRATDAVAISIGRAYRNMGRNWADRQLLRIGKGASLKSFEKEELLQILRGTETEYLAQIESLAIELARTEAPATKAMLRKTMKEIRAAMNDSARRHFLDDLVRVVVSTSFLATTFLCCGDVKEEIEAGRAPFTTLVIDEAGLISRATIAPLSLLAARRIVLVGDSKQLAPISRISRILEPIQGNWLAKSGLSHLDRIAIRIDGVKILNQQRRMHPRVCEVVSAFQYDNFLETAPDVAGRPFDLPALLKHQPRAIWYVLDDDGEDLPSIRAERGPANRSWVRTATKKILAKLFCDPTMREANGLYITPFKAQATSIHSYFAASEMHSWTASTVHSQQGWEADVVVFDTVNAGSYGWPYEEWKRLVNVALSRSREAIIVLASRAEMNEPYLRPLLRHMSPRVLGRTGRRIEWKEVPLKKDFVLPDAIRDAQVQNAGDSTFLIGNQIARRKALRPVLSTEQERLCRFDLDGKPRLVRGVAGSGKTVVLAHWLMHTVRRFENEENARIWAVFANRSLQSLIGDSIETAWANATEGSPFPWNRVELHHIREILDVMLPEVGLSAKNYEFDYDTAASAYLERTSAEDVVPRCDALFIDEAQDLGPSALKLLASIVRKQLDGDENSRAINIFYDNAQNIYGRGTPKWADFGLDLRGRSSVMKESFRSTRPITEFALNVLYRLQPPENNPDHKELVTRGLIERTERGGRDWWKVRFNQVEGPVPQFRQFIDLDRELEGVSDYCTELIREQNVKPSDMCVIYNGRNIKYRLETQVAPVLAALGVELSVQTNKPFERSHNVLLATTAHSFKGYDAEIVIIPAADQYAAKGKGILANTLYVAMTRARSMLVVFSQRKRSKDAESLYDIMEDCLGSLEERPVIEADISPQDDFFALLECVGHQHRKWLVQLWNRYKISQEPLTTKKGEIVAEPLFNLRVGEQLFACFGSAPPRQRIARRLEDIGVRLACF